MERRKKRQQRQQQQQQQQEQLERQQSDDQIRRTRSRRLSLNFDIVNRPSVSPSRVDGIRSLLSRKIIRMKQEKKSSIFVFILFEFVRRNLFST